MLPWLGESELRESTSKKKERDTKKLKCSICVAIAFGAGAYISLLKQLGKNMGPYEGALMNGPIDVMAGNKLEIHPSVHTRKQYLNLRVGGELKGQT